MSIEEKVKLVEGVFDQLDQQIAALQNATSLHCKWGCGKCCYKADIEATILEFLPFALFLHQQNQAEEWLNNLQETDSSICLILNPTQNGAGLCSQYKHRGLICRLFGYSARTTKYGKPELVTCQIIKTEQQENFVKAEAAIEQGLDVPVMSNFYMQLHSIDFELTREFFPINVAMRKAVETVLQYYAYR
ncbi:MAG: YkgJ family cysteine cluster protein [Cyclobacteriaceae bacterium]|jgi:Fe-S-cluster containining protein|nr:YkgJ family cysteine cluster protein [Flammeovirgaceae bacterium]